MDFLNGLLPHIVNGLALGVLSLYALVEGFREYAAVFIVASVIADYVDGKFARKYEKEDAFGKYLDSIADIAVFGFYPVVIAFLVTSLYLQAPRSQWQF